MSLTNYLEGKFVDHLTGNAAFTAPDDLFMGLYSATPGETGGGTELTGNGYARQVITFGAYSAGAALNDSEAVFEASGGNWVTATHAGIFDDVAAGNLLWYGGLDDPEQINDTGTLTFEAGDVSLALD